MYLHSWRLKIDDLTGDPNDSCSIIYELCQDLEKHKNQDYTTEVLHITSKYNHDITSYILLQRENGIVWFQIRIGYLHKNVLRKKIVRIH